MTMIIKQNDYHLYHQMLISKHIISAYVLVIMVLVPINKCTFFIAVVLLTWIKMEKMCVWND